MTSLQNRCVRPPDRKHLLSKTGDAVYVANVIAAWAGRYLDRPETMTEAEVETGLVLGREMHGGKFQQEILTGPHRLLADEPVKLGGSIPIPALTISCWPASAPVPR